MFPTLIHEPAHADVHNNAEGQEAEQDRGAAVAHQGQGNAGDGHQSDAHTYIDGDLEEHDCHDAHDDERSGRIGGGLGVLNEADEDEEVKQQHPDSADETVLFAEGGEDEVGVGDRQEVALGLGALAGSFAPESA